MDFYAKVFQTVLFHTPILHYRMQGNLKWKVVSFMLPVPMSEVCIWSINYLVMSILLAEMCQWIAIFTNVTFAHYLK